LTPKKETKTKKKQLVRNSTRKLLPNLNLVKSFAGKHQPLPNLIWGNKNSTSTNQRGAKNLHHLRRTRGETPSREGGVPHPY
jgi:hypothetical protein